MKRVQSSDEAAAQYALALMSPFDDKAHGVRVPDMFHTPSCTYTLRGSYVLSTNAVNTNSCVQFYANPVFSAVENNVVSTGDMFNYAASTNALGVVTAALLQSTGISYRVVAGGICIKNAQASLSAVGELEVAQLPSVLTGFGPIALGTVNMTASSMTSFKSGFAITGGQYVGLQGLPSGDMFRVGELIGNDLMMPFHICDSRAFDWHSTQDSNLMAAGLAEIAGGVYNTATGAIVNADSENPDLAQSTGWTSPTINLLGFPLSTTCLEIEFIYHLEFQPNLTVQADLVPTAPPTSVSAPGVFEKIVSKASASNFSRLLSSVKAHLTRHKTSYITAAKFMGELMLA
jgi:hypothetical protein